MSDKRTESDSIGQLQIPADAYYGVQTYRGYENFHITGTPLNRVFVYNIIKIKKAAAMTNMQSGLISRTMGEAIIAACDEALADKFDDSFITDGIQGGAGKGGARAQRQNKGPRAREENSRRQSAG